MIQAWISQQITEMCAHKQHFVLALEIQKATLRTSWEEPII